jgi:AAA+ superfamily predicted ATPase
MRNSFSTVNPTNTSMDKYIDYYCTNIDHILDELKRIDLLICSFVEKWRKNSKNIDFPGLYISEAEVDAILNGEKTLSADLTEAEILRISITEKKKASLERGIPLRLNVLEKLFSLAPFEIEAVLIVLASELDLKYTKLFAYLQDDVTKKKPTIGLILRLLCKSKEDSIDAREHFNFNSPLINNLLFHLDNQDLPLLERSIKLDERIVGFLLGADALDSHVESFAKINKPKTEFDELALPNDLKQQLITLYDTDFDYSPLFLIEGFNGVVEVAEAFCSKTNVSLLTADLKLIKPENLETNIKRFFREAKLQRATVYLNGFDSVNEETKSNVLSAIEDFDGAVFVYSKTDFSSKRKTIKVTLPNPSYLIRQRMWRSLINNQGAADELATKFRFGKNKATAALESARTVARMRNPANPVVTQDDLYWGCKSQSNPISSASKIISRYTWEDIVLPEDKKVQLREVCSYVKQYATVYETWGFDKHSRSKGLNVLFSGPSGTGKTMAAEIVSGELRLDLYKIDLSLVVSKYIGETEKNLNEIFKDAEECNAVLFFDEADALFGKRSEVKDAHDRYANIETNYLLQKMEEHEGIAILATNMSKSIDDAFLRRMNFIVEFPFPTQECRLAIWEKVFPEQTPLDKKIDFEFLSKLQISGGNIKNIALAGAFLAAENSGKLTMEHIAKAARREFEKIGKVYGKEEFGKYYDVIK